MEELAKMSLAKKIAKISEEVGAIPKGGRNAQQGYAYIEYAAVAAKISEIQGRYGVAIIPSVKSYTVDKVQGKGNNLGYHYCLTMNFRAINGDNPEEYIESEWLSEATDFGDKGINKAITAGVKYFTMRLYNISERGDDADAVTPEQRPINKPKPNPQKFQKKDVAVDPQKIAAVRKKLKEISTVEDVDKFWQILRPGKTYQELLEGDFTKRKQEILNASTE